MKTLCRLGLICFLAGCATNEYTGRRQLMLISDDQEKQLGVAAYQEVLAQSPISSAPAEVDPVRRVGKRIAEAANRPDFQWEFNTIVDDKTVNAWCLPGGKIAFYTGIFPILEDEDGMAFVMGHEVGHALMHHGAERMSQQMVAGGATSILGTVLGQKDTGSSQAVMAAFGMAANVGVLLPFSRKHEAESDQVGLDLMAKAGYDPRASVRVWKKMSALGGGQPPEWLSTHPSHESRIQDLESRMPAALAIFEKSRRATDVAKLPAIPGNRVPAKQGAAAAAGFASGAPSPVQVRSGPARPATLQDGRKVLQIEVEFDRDVYVATVDVSGRNLDVLAGAPGGQKKILLVPGDVAGGPVALTFRGTASGRPFTASTRSASP